MQLVLLAKDTESGEKKCPSVYDDLDSTDFVLVGPTVDDAVIDNVLPHEAVIRINREVVIEAVRRHLGAL
jgi:hypothetical protein